MKIFAGELKKVFANRLVIGIFAAALLINGFILFLSDSITTYYSPDEYKAMYADLGDSPSEEVQAQLAEKAVLLEIAELFGDTEIDVEWARACYGEKADEYIKKLQSEQLLKYCGSLKAENALYKDVIAQLDSAKGYTAYLDGIQERADAMTGVSIFRQNTSEFGKKNILKTAEDFSKLYPIAENVKFAPSKGVKMASNSPFTDIISLLLVLVLCYQLMIREKQDGSLFLMKSNTRGRLAFITAKVFAIICGSVAMTVLLYSGNILLAQMKYGLGDLDRCVQSVGEYVSCGFDMTVREFLLYYIICKVVIFVFFAVLMLLASYLVKNASGIYLSLAAFDGLSAVLYVLIPSNHMFNFFKYVNFFYFQQSQLILCQYQNINVFTQPILSTWCFFMVAALIPVLIAVNLWAFCNCRVSAGSKSGFKFKRKDRKITSNLQKHEFYKLAVTNRALLILVAFIALQWFTAASYREHLTIEEVEDRSFINRVGGVVTQENQERINAAYKEFDALEQQLSELVEEFNEGKLTQMEYTAKSAPLGEKLSKREALERVEARYHELLELSEQTGKTYHLIFEREYNLLTNNENNDTVRALEILIVLIACMGGYFAMENASGMEKIISTCLGGKRRVAGKKLISGAIVTFIAAVITYLPDVLLTHKNFGMKNLGATAHSLKQLEGVGADITIWQYLLIVFLIRLLGAAIAVMIIHYVSDKTKNHLIAAVISTAVLALPPVMKLLGLNLLNDVSLIPLLSGNLLFRKGSFLIALFGLCYIAAAVIIALKLTSRKNKN